MVSNISRLMRLLVKYFISSQVDPAGLWEEADGWIIVQLHYQDYCEVIIDHYYYIYIQTPHTVNTRSQSGLISSTVGSLLGEPEIFSLSSLCPIATYFSVVYFNNEIRDNSQTKMIIQSRKYSSFQKENLLFFSSLFDAIVRRAPNIEIISDVEPDLTYLVGSPSSQCGKAGAGNRELGWESPSDQSHVASGCGV